LLALLITIPLMILAVAVAVVPLLWGIAHQHEWDHAAGSRHPVFYEAATDLSVDDVTWSTDFAPSELDWSQDLEVAAAQPV
jgi:nitrogen fixation-related uncharacterized protein